MELAASDANTQKRGERSPSAQGRGLTAGAQQFWWEPDPVTQTEFLKGACSQIHTDLLLPCCLVSRGEHSRSWALGKARSTFHSLRCLWGCLASPTCLSSCPLTFWSKEPFYPYLALQCLSLAKAQMPLDDNLGALLSTGSPNQMCLGCRAQAAGQEVPEMLQILSFLQ